MDLLVWIIIGIGLIVIATVYFLDLLGRNLDDPNFKKFEGAYRDLRLGAWPKVSDKRKNEDRDTKHGQN